jgi:serine/threonine-protein kinase
VKPANLLLDRDGNVHVSDFGIASASGADMLTEPGHRPRYGGLHLARAGEGRAGDAASDRYALGVVAFELLTGDGRSPATRRRPRRSRT